LIDGQTNETIYLFPYLTNQAHNKRICRSNSTNASTNDTEINPK